MHPVIELKQFEPLNTAQQHSDLVTIFRFVANYDDAVSLFGHRNKRLRVSIDIGIPKITTVRTWLRRGLDILPHNGRLLNLPKPPLG
jgi:hypothetical protein